MSRLAAFNFRCWIDEHRHLLKPPVCNRQIREEADPTATVAGGPNRRTDFHDDPVEEFRYRLEGDMALKVHDGTEVELVSVVRDLRPLYDTFYVDEAARTCPDCGAVRPGSEPPAERVRL